MVTENITNYYRLDFLGSSIYDPWMKGSIRTNTDVNAEVGGVSLKRKGRSAEVMKAKDGYRKVSAEAEFVAWPRPDQQQTRNSLGRYLKISPQLLPSSNLSLEVGGSRQETDSAVGIEGK
jgi:hypothetical protein